MSIDSADKPWIGDRRFTEHGSEPRWRLLDLISPEPERPTKVGGFKFGSLACSRVGPGWCADGGYPHDDGYDRRLQLRQPRHPVGGGERGGSPGFLHSLLFCAMRARSSAGTLACRVCGGKGAGANKHIGTRACVSNLCLCARARYAARSHRSCHSSSTSSVSAAPTKHFSCRPFSKAT